MFQKDAVCEGEDDGIKSRLPFKIFSTLLLTKASNNFQHYSGSKFGKYFIMSQDTKVQMQFRKDCGPSVKVKNCHAKPTSFSGAMEGFSPQWAN